MDIIPLFPGRTDSATLVSVLESDPYNKMLWNLLNGLFGTGKKTEIIQKQIDTQDTTTESTPRQSSLSIDDEIMILAKHYGGLVSGMTLSVELRELLDLIPRRRRKADAYYALGKKLKDEYGVELRITSRTGKGKEDGV